MNIQKYQYVNAYNKYQRPEQLRSDFRHFLAMVERSKINTPAAINTYNLLCGIEALLCRYETVSKETILAVNVIDDVERCSEYLLNLHNKAMHEDVYNPKMIVDERERKRPCRRHVIRGFRGTGKRETQAFLPVLRANDFAVWLSAAAGRENGGRENRPRCAR